MAKLYYKTDEKASYESVKKEQIKISRNALKRVIIGLTLIIICLIGFIIYG